MKCTYVRCNHRIENLVTHVIETYASINQAKRASGEIQRAVAPGKEGYKGLGRGHLRVVPRL